VIFSNLIEDVGHVLVLRCMVVVNWVSWPPPSPKPCLSQKRMYGISCYTSHFCKLPGFLWEKQFFKSFLNGLTVHEMSDFVVSWLVQGTISEMCSVLFSLSFILQWAVDGPESK
jgi:hypothetical protein